MDAINVIIKKQGIDRIRIISDSKKEEMCLLSLYKEISDDLMVLNQKVKMIALSCGFFD